MERKMANHSPNFSGFRRGNAPRGWISEHVDDWVAARIKGRAWVEQPLPRFPTVIRKHELLRRTGLSYPTIWAMEKRGEFPKGFPLTYAQGAVDAAD
jgi:predicted DNA-binding transcriptional regulator AlpA